MKNDARALKYKSLEIKEFIHEATFAYRVSMIPL